MFTDQSSYDIRFEWGERGLEAVRPGCAAIVVVDVFSFCTAVDVAVSRGAAILPCAEIDDAAARFAAARGATLAGPYRSANAFSLSPASLTEIPAGTRLVLASRNGARLSLRAAESGLTIAACLRNASAVARFLSERRGPVAVIAGGERWPDDSLRPAWEDLVGAGAVIAGLPGARSPEAEAAVAAYRAASDDLPRRLTACSSGRELIERGFVSDVELATARDVSDCVPVLVDGEFAAAASAR